MTLKIVPRSRRFSEGHAPSENRGTRLVCTCPDASTEGAHFSFLVPTIYFVELWSSGQVLKSAHLRRTRRDKCTLGASLDFPTGHEPRKIVGTSERFSKSFFKVFFLEKIFLDIFWRSFRGLKMYSEKKRFMGQDF